jgi:lipoprotein-anchoring transpeptidase ErfK/SrfK
MNAEQKWTATSRKQAANFFKFALLIALAVRSSQAQESQPPVPAVAAGLRHERKVLVSIPHRRLAVIKNGAVAKIYPIAVGASTSPSPTGTFQIRNRLVKPTYFHPGTVIPAGPGNPLGTRWIGLSTRGYGIHGTNVEDSIGKAASHGCIRMHRADLEELFTTMQVGDEVEIRSETDGEMAQIFGAADDDNKSNPAVATDRVGADKMGQESSALSIQDGSN